MANSLSLREKILKHGKTTSILALSFLFVIVIGSILLSLPVSNNNSSSVSYVEHLFTAVSATCVTGLVTINVSSQYTLFGQIIIMILIQIGGLGLMSFFVMFFTVLKKHLYQNEKKLIQDALNKENLDNIQDYIKNVFIYTFIFEFIGFVLLAFKFVPIFKLPQGLFNALFLSVSAFCNAGIDNFSLSSLEMFTGDVYVNLIIMALIITGGLGFAVWFDLSDLINEKLKKKSLRTLIHHLSLHTKLVITATTILIVSGMALFLITEFNNADTIKNLNLFDKVLVSSFNSVTLRTAGFSTVNIGHMRNATLLFMCLFMLIGGSPGGTAGGIKTTTFALLVLSIRTIISNKSNITYKKREINQTLLNKAYLVFTLYGITIFTALFVLSMSDEVLSVIDLLFETISAIGTVGLSTGITPQLSLVGKLVIMVVMFIGRVGPITIILSTLNKTTSKEKIRYAEEDVLIG